MFLCQSKDNLWIIVGKIPKGTKLKYLRKNRSEQQTYCMYLLWFVLRWGVYGTKLRFQFASWQCGWGFWCLWQFSGSPASPLEIVNVQSVDEVLTSKPVGPWNKYEIHSQNTKPSSAVFCVEKRVDKLV